jgi:hypothetical protein
MIQSSPIQLSIQEGGQLTQGWVEWFEQTDRQSKFQGTFTTAGRPTNALTDGDWGIDTTLGYPVWYYDGGWINSSGTTV